MKGDRDAMRLFYLKNGFDKRLVRLNHRSPRRPVIYSRNCFPALFLK
ncbi:hypothetical protein B4113_2916 [Geobacillus sp. B4113_201601]|nr:hypothetical protein B4113_2916 [Geobacillus sp. B4113_201601]